MAEPKIPAEVRAEISRRQLAAPGVTHANLRLALFLTVYPAVMWAAFSVDHPAMWALAWFTAATLLLGAVAGQHEALHGNLYRSRAANHAAGFFWGGTVLFPYAMYRASHLEHHRHTHAEGDTEPITEYTSFAQHLALTPLSGLLFIGMHWVDMIKHFCGRSPAYLRVQRQRRLVTLNALWLAALVAALVAATMWDPRAVLYAYVIPYLLGATVLVVIVTLPEHYGCRVGALPVFDTTRTTTATPRSAGRTGEPPTTPRTTWLRRSRRIASAKCTHSSRTAARTSRAPTSAGTST